MHLTKLFNLFFVNAALVAAISPYAYSRGSHLSLLERDLFDYDERDLDMEDLRLLYVRQLLDFEARDAYALAGPPDWDYKYSQKEDDQKVKLNGFATFDVRKKSSDKGRNPKTGERLTLPSWVCLQYLGERLMNTLTLLSLA